MIDLEIVYRKANENGIWNKKPKIIDIRKTLNETVRLRQIYKCLSAMLVGSGGTLNLGRWSMSNSQSDKPSRRECDRISRTRSSLNGGRIAE